MKNILYISITISFLLYGQNTKAQDSIRFNVCPILWSNSAPVKVQSVVVNINNPSFPTGQLVFYPISGADCIEVVIPPSDQSPDATYSISANKAPDGLNGITINDDLRHSDHILGIWPFDLIPQFLAADVNRSGSITTFDMVLVRKRLLGLENPDDLTWGFIPEYWTFSNMNNPFETNNGLCCQDLSLSELTDYNGNSMNLVAFKRGDVDGDANPQFSDFTPNFNQTIQIGILNQPIGFVDEETKISFLPADANQTVRIFQINLTIDLTAFEVLGIESQFTTLYNIIDNKISIYGYNWTQLNASNELFAIKVKCLKTGNIADYISFSTTDNQSAAAIGTVNNPILANIEFSVVQPIIKTNEITKVIDLKIFPNPANASGTNITFQSNIEEDTQLIVSDLVGKTIFQKNVNIKSGDNQINIPALAISNGACFYRFILSGKVFGGKILNSLPE
jgi:hypothetical protein